MGNRGILHNERQEIVRPYKLKAWIICRLRFKDRQRTVMSPGSYTELFFLDEATALAAGHRPCYECRRKRAQAFRTAWAAANPTMANGANTKMGQIDAVLHRERLTNARFIKDRRKKTYTAPIGTLPAGTFIVLEEVPYLLWNGRLYPWTITGYQKPLPRFENQIVNVLTPHSTVGAITKGFVPMVHKSATL